MAANIAPRYDLTRADQIHFVNQIQEWMNTLGLNDWHLLSVEMTPDLDALAMCHVYADNHAFRIQCRTHWDIPVNQQNIDYIVVHELMHVVLGPLWKMAFDACHPQNNDVLNRIEHEAIARLCRCMANPCRVVWGIEGIEEVRSGGTPLAGAADAGIGITKMWVDECPPQPEGAGSGKVAEWMRNEQIGPGDGGQVPVRNADMQPWPREGRGPVGSGVSGVANGGIGVYGPVGSGSVEAAPSLASGGGYGPLGRIEPQDSSGSASEDADRLFAAVRGGGKAVKRGRNPVTERAAYAWLATHRGDLEGFTLEGVAVESFCSGVNWKDSVNKDF